MTMTDGSLEHPIWCLAHDADGTERTPLACQSDQEHKGRDWLLLSEGLDYSVRVQASKYLEDSPDGTCIAHDTHITLTGIAHGFAATSTAHLTVADCRRLVHVLERVIADVVHG